MEWTFYWSRGLIELKRKEMSAVMGILTGHILYYGQALREIGPDACYLNISAEIADRKNHLKL